jgi:hypothetical protein
MSRSTLNDLTGQLRGMTDTTPVDYHSGTIQWWDDDQLQQVLDRHRTDLLRAPLEVRPTVGAGGTLVWQDYYSTYRNLEQTLGGTALFVVEDSVGNDAGTSLWSADYARGVVSFVSNTAGTAYFLTGRAYDLNAAAADVWRTKAAQAAKNFDFSTDNHSLSRQQIMDNALKMADYYAAKAAPEVTTLYRSDTC